MWVCTMRGLNVKANIGQAMNISRYMHDGANIMQGGRVLIVLGVVDNYYFETVCKVTIVCNLCKVATVQLINKAAAPPPFGRQNLTRIESLSRQGCHCARHQSVTSTCPWCPKPWPLSGKCTPDRMVIDGHVFLVNAQVWMVIVLACPLAMHDLGTSNNHLQPRALLQHLISLTGCCECQCIDHMKGCIQASQLLWVPMHRSLRPCLFNDS